MVRLLALLFLLAFAPAPAHAGPAARAFTEKVAQVIAARLPQLSVAPDGDLALSVRRQNGNKVSVSLTNRYPDYKSDPANLGAIVDLIVGSLGEKPPAVGKPDRTRIVPVIKDRQWLDETRQSIRTSGGAQDVLFEEFNKELVVVYAEDTEKRTRYLMSSEDIGVDRKDLRKLAVDNLQRILPKIEMRQHDDVFAMLTAGGDYEASLLLFDGIWSGDQIKVDGDIVVAIPAKDVVLITGSRNRKGLEVVRKMAVELAGQNRYRLTDTLFVYRNGRFTRFGRK